MPQFHSCCLPFQSEGNYAFVNTMGPRQLKNSRCFKPACRRESSTFWKWHCLRKIAKRLIHPSLTWCQKHILSNAVKINGIQSRMSLKLRIKVVAFFLGHPVYVQVIYMKYDENKSMLLTEKHCLYLVIIVLGKTEQDCAIEHALQRVFSCHKRC